MLFTKSKKRFNYVEVAKYIPNLDRVIRLMIGSNDDRRPEMWDVSDLERFRSKHGNSGIYTSVFHYDTIDLDEAVRYGSLYFDFDSPAIEEAKGDTQRVYDHIAQFVPESQIRLYFTGSKGFHIEVEAGALGVDPSNELDVFYRHIAEDINRKLNTPTMDFAVYDKRRMWRLAESQHQATGLFKNEIPRNGLDAEVQKIKDYCAIRRPYTPPPVEFNTKANQWYKEYVADWVRGEEERKQELARKRAELFSTYGTSLLGKHSDAYVRNSWKKTLENLREAKTGSRNRLLSRQSYRLFLTLLEAGKDPQEAFKPLVEVALEIGLEQNESKATVKSALQAAEKEYKENPERIPV